MDMVNVMSIDLMSEYIACGVTGFIMLCTLIKTAALLACNDLQSGFYRVAEMPFCGRFSVAAVASLNRLIDAVMFKRDFLYAGRQAIGGRAEQHHGPAQTIKCLGQKAIVTGQINAMMKLAVDLRQRRGTCLTVDQLRFVDKYLIDR